MTDEDELAIPPGGDPAGARLSPEEIYQRLVSIKGSADNIVLLGVGGAAACDATQGVYGAARETTRLRQLTDMFIASGLGMFWDLCTGRLEDHVDDAIQIIDTACDAF